MSQSDTVMLAVALTAIGIAVMVNIHLLLAVPFWGAAVVAVILSQTKFRD